MNESIECRLLVIKEIREKLGLLELAISGKEIIQELRLILELKALNEKLECHQDFNTPEVKTYPQTRAGSVIKEEPKQMILHYDSSMSGGILSGKITHTFREQEIEPGVTVNHCEKETSELIAKTKILGTQPCTIWENTLKVGNDTFTDIRELNQFALEEGRHDWEDLINHYKLQYTLPRTGFVMYW